jgi:hypothetical protein
VGGGGQAVTAFGRNIFGLCAITFGVMSMDMLVFRETPGFSVLVSFSFFHLTVLKPVVMELGFNTRLRSVGVFLHGFLGLGFLYFAIVSQ